MSDEHTDASLAARRIRTGDAEALARLFERDGCPCYCRYWHFQGTNKEWEARCAFDAAQNRAELIFAVEHGAVEGDGIVASRVERPGEIIGWLKLVPRPALDKLLARSPYKGLAQPGESIEVASIGCLLIDPAERRRGVARALVAAAIEQARRDGACALEAYPRDVREPVHDGELWMGPRSVYDALGFEPVRGDGGQYPVLRRLLG